MRMKIPEQGSCDPIAPLELPHSLHAFRRVSHADSLNKVIQLCFKAFSYVLHISFTV